jgi:hypothetical protein
MKSLTTVAVGMLAAFLLLAPTLAYAATTVSVSTDKPSYKGSDSIAVSGTVTPAPGAGTAVYIKVANPSGTAVFVDSVSVNGATGAFSDSLVAGGNANWVTGTYTVTATWGSTPSTAVSGSTTFSYQAVGQLVPFGGNALNVVVQAGSLGYAGQSFSVAALAYWTNGTAANIKVATADLVSPSGSVISLGAGASVASGKGMWMWTTTLPTTAATGTWFAHIVVNSTGPAGVLGNGLGSFTVDPVANPSYIQSVNASLAALNKNTAASLSAIQASLGSLSGKVDGLSTSLGTLTTNLGNLQTSVNTLGTKLDSDVASLQSAVSAIASGTNSSLASLNTKVSNLQTAVGNNQTYVIVVAALAAITLVLELAILIRKLS